MERLLAVVMAGGMGERLGILSQERAKPAVPFAGKYRVIDFTLSNCVNSEIYNIIVLTQYQPVSLTEHIGIGEPWRLNIPDRNIRLLQPYLAREGGRDWYKGTADAVYQNLNHITRENPEEVLILSGDHVYKMDYQPMLAFHRENGADVSLAVTPMPRKELERFGTVVTDESHRVNRFLEKVKDPPSNLVSMGIYLFNIQTLKQWLGTELGHDFGRDILPRMVHQCRIFAYVFTDYWRDIGTLESYYQTNMEMLLARSFLADTRWPIHTRQGEWCPTMVSSRATVRDSLICDGCTIEGHVEHSIIAPGVHVAEGAIVRDSIIMERTRIGENSTIDHAILDKEVTISAASTIGFGDDYSPNRLYPDILSSGLTIIGKRTTIPAGYSIGRNCIIYDSVTADDLPHPPLKSGQTVKRKDSPKAQGT